MRIGKPGRKSTLRPWYFPTKPDFNVHMIVTPYQGYESSSRLMFDVNLKDSKYHPKEKVIGIELDGKAKVYAFSELSRTGSPVKNVFNKVPIQIHYDRKTQTAVIRDSKNTELPSVVGFWLAWYAFHPTTKVFIAEQKQ
jgi:hypothetical protein